MTTIRLPRDFFDDAAPFKIKGVYCKIIPLTQGRFAIVDAEDYPSLSARLWCAWLNPRSGVWYAQRREGANGGHIVFMHRQVLELKRGDARQGDHANQEGLDNRRLNLRIATHSQNLFNQRSHSHNSSGFKGVHRHTACDMYSAEIRVNGKRLYLGIRRTAKQAFDELYVPAAKKYHGDFARLA